MSFYRYNLQKALDNFRKKYSENFEIVEDFAEDLLANEISDIRIYSYICWLRRFLEIVPKNFEQWEKRDVRKIINYYQIRVKKGETSKNTLLEVKKTLKKFFIYESGARIGEIGSMRVKDVSFDDYGAIVWLPKSKTVRRKLRIVYSARYLSEWLSDHPMKGEVDAPLWIKLSGRNALKTMDYDDIRMQIKKIAKRAGIKKSIGAKYMGWVNGSKMVGVYVHLASEDVDEAILKMHGIKTNGNNKDLEVKQCPRCLMVNPSTSRFCSRCGLPLTEEAIREVEEWEKRKNEAFNELTNPSFIKVFMGLQREIEMLKAEIEKMRSENGGMKDEIPLA